MEHLSENEIDVFSLYRQAHDRSAGAVVMFSGEVREGNEGKEVSFLHYEAAGSMASKMIAQILEDATQRWDLRKAIAVHRVGKVEVMQTAVIVITAAAHRQEAYAANRFIIDRIKHEVPIWKCEYFVDGTREWGGSCACKTVHEHE